MKTSIRLATGFAGVLLVAWHGAACSDDEDATSGGNTAGAAGTPSGSTATGGDTGGVGVGAQGGGGQGGADAQGGGGMGQGGAVQGCDACANMHCSSELDECEMDTTCDDWTNCYQDCIDNDFTDACFDACDTMFADVQRLYQSVQDCVCPACPAECAPACD